MEARTIKPGYLISLAVTLRGGVNYQRVDIATETDADKEITKTEVTKTVNDASERERGSKVASACRATLAKLCVPWHGGAMILPLSSKEEFEIAHKRVVALADDFNKTAVHSRIGVYLLRGEIASTDEEAARAIGEEVRTLIDAMSAGIDKLDPKAIRDAADRARKLGAVLDASQEIAVSEAVKQARKAARTIVARVEKESEDASIVLKDIQRGAIEKARLAFLDLDPIQTSPEALPAVDVGRVAELDLEPLTHEAPESGETLKAASA